MGRSSSCQWMPSGEKPRFRFISRFLLSQRNTPAYCPLKGTTALLKTLLDEGIRLRGMMGLALYRQTTSEQFAGRSSQGMLGRGCWVIVSLHFLICHYEAIFT